MTNAFTEPVLYSSFMRLAPLVVVLFSSLAAALHINEKRVNVREHVVPATDGTVLTRTECLGLWASFGIYGSYQGGLLIDMERSGWKHERTWNSVSAAETVSEDDMAMWFSDSKGKCIISFQGAEDVFDYFSLMLFEPVDYAGVSGIHKGALFELLPLLAIIDFRAIREKCKYLTAVGHSLGGALAQLFALLINKDRDPLGAGLKVDEIYTYGTTSPTSSNGTDKYNDQAADTCFPGRQFINTVENEGMLLLDSADSPMSGGRIHQPLLASDKELLVMTASGEFTGSLEFTCGQQLPENATWFPSGSWDGEWCQSAACGCYVKDHPCMPNPSFVYKLHTFNFYARNMKCF